MTEHVISGIPELPDGCNSVVVDYPKDGDFRIMYLHDGTFVWTSIWLPGDGDRLEFVARNTPESESKAVSEFSGLKRQLSDLQSKNDQLMQLLKDLGRQLAGQSTHMSMLGNWVNQGISELAK